MIKVKISNFIRRNKHKIQDFLTKLIMVAIAVLIATIMLSGIRRIQTDTKEDSKEVYKPTETVIKGRNVSEKQYVEDSNIVNGFLEDCNLKTPEEAYSLLSDDCKNELYPTLEIFKTNYYNDVFDKNREYNLQAWISTSEYTVYKIRYPQNMISTGEYDPEDVYEDYITLNKKSGDGKVSIGELVVCDECNIVTKTSELEATVTKKKIYISDEEYEIKIRNNTDKKILLDNLKDNKKINLIGSYGVKYGVYMNKIFLNNLIINPGEAKTVVLKFKKKLSSNHKSKEIEFLNIIKDYELYMQDQENYNDISNITIKLED